MKIFLRQCTCGFNLIIIYYLDSIQVEAIIPIILTSKGGQTIMAGDQKQMGPIIIENLARDRGLANSFMGRLFERYLKIVDDTMMVSIKYENIPKGRI